MESQMIFLLKSILLNGLIALIDGIILKFLWGWFIVTTFKLSPLSLSQAVGISMIITYLTFQTTIPADRDDLKEMCVNRILVIPVTAFVVGLVTQLFI